ncbi:MAG: hypothetical protein FWF85_06300 [Clostridiales bacterium]|jgi:hypothetical protein|nr:hypothetical protein [Clostridiales bacterium]MDR2713217.1 hypothetical protein [Clostridiales bacterium]
MPKKNLLTVALLVSLLTLLTFNAVIAAGPEDPDNIADETFIATQNETNTTAAVGDPFSAALSAPEKIYVRETNKLDYVVSVNNIDGDGADVFMIEAAFDIQYLNYQGYTFNISSDLNPIQTSITYDGITGKLALGIILGTPGALLKAPTETPLVTFHFTLKETVVPTVTVIESFLTKVSAAIFHDSIPTSLNAVLTKPGAPVSVLLHPLGYEGGELDEATISWLVYHHLYKTSAATDWDDIKKYDLNGNSQIDLADIVALWSLIGK